MKPAFTIGVDYGTNSVRAVVVDCADGRVLGTSVFDYPSGDQGVLLDPRDPHLARQNPGDYLLGLDASISGAVEEAARQPGFTRARVVGIGVDTTGSTPIPVDEDCQPLALYPRLHGQLAAYAWLWKDHTAAEEAAAITETARRHAPEYLAPIGGTYSSEWFWSKIWRCLKVAPEIFDQAVQLDRAGRLHPGGARGHQGPQGRRCAACAPPATRRCTRTRGAGCRRRRSSPGSTRSWPTCGIASTTTPGRPTGPPGASRRPGRRRSACPRASRSRWAASTRTTAPSARACARARS